MDSNEERLRESYNNLATDFLHTRTKGKGIIGFWNREIEQPTMFKLVPTNLSNKKLLDVGCGPGIHMKKYVERGATGIGIDFSESMINLAKENCPKAEFKVGNANLLDFKDNTFDIITSSLALDHIKDFSQSIKEIKRVLKKKGQFFVSLPHPIRNLLKDPNEETIALGGDYFDKKEIFLNISGGGKKFIDYPRTLEEYINTFIEQGFEIQKFTEGRPTPECKEKYPELDEHYYKMPMICFFSLIKK